MAGVKGGVVEADVTGFMGLGSGLAADEIELVVAGTGMDGPGMGCCVQRVVVWWWEPFM